MKFIEIVSENKITEQAAPNIAQIVNFLGNQNPGLKAPSVQNALTQFLNNNPDLARQAAANMNTAPGVKINPSSAFKGLLGRVLGPIGMILTPTPAGQGSEYIGSATQIAYEFQKSLLKSDPQAYLDLVNASVDGMPEDYKQRIEDGTATDPRKSDDFKAAEEAAKMLRQPNVVPAEVPSIPPTQPDWWPEEVPFTPGATPEVPVVPSTEPKPEITEPPVLPALPATNPDTPPVTDPTPPVEKPQPDVPPTGPIVAPIKPPVTAPNVVKPPATAPGAITLPQVNTTPRTGTGATPKSPGGKNGKNRRKLELPSLGGGAPSTLKSIKPTLLQINDPLNLKRNIQ